MFKILFHYPRVLARHCQGPSAQARERYLPHCADQGAALDSLLGTARELLAIAQRLDLTTDQMISIRQVEAAAERWVHYQQRRGRVRDPKGSRLWFIQTALSWLRFLGRLEAPDKKPLPFADLVEHFAACMREQRGLSEVTIRQRCWHAQKFEYPLVSVAGEAILRYLQQVRPRCARRELFLTLKAPFRPLSTGGMYHVVSSRLSELNIQSLRHGPIRSGMPAPA